MRRALTPIAKDMQVVGADGLHLGVVDQFDGNFVSVECMDAGGFVQHCQIPVLLISQVNSAVVLKTSISTIKSRWI